MTQPHLILLPGWGLHSATLDPLIECLHQALSITLLPLPDFNQHDWLAQLQTQIPAGSWLAGWSLGGMLATHLAHLNPSGYAGLISLSSNARFSATHDWSHAMGALTFAAFKYAVRRCPVTALKQFTRLCAQGDRQAKSLARHLQQLQTEPLNTPHALAGLEQLAQLDNRPALTEYPGAQLHLLAERDALVPSAVEPALQALNAQAHIEVVPGSHAFVYTHAHAVAERMLSFVRENSHA